MYYDVFFVEPAKSARFDYDSSLYCLYMDLMSKNDFLNMKRIIDIIFSSLLILFLAPLMLLVMILIKIDSYGPVLFKQIRVGLNGEIFTFYKFRSMKFDLLYNDPIVSNDGTLYKPKYDNRISRIGKIIRKTSIDELPQLFNVFLGNMSLIGPRPLISSMVEPFPYISKIRNIVKPGITGLWQVGSREKNTSVLDMIDLDLHYIKNCSLSLDFVILLKTLKVVFSCKGAM